TKIYDQVYGQTKDEIKAEQAAVGWCGQVVDTNGDGKITRPWNVLRQGRGTVENVLYQGDTAGGARGARGAARAVRSVDPKLDTMVSYNLYSVITSTVETAILGSA